MQAWIVKHKRENLYATLTSRGEVAMWLAPTIAWNKEDAEGMNSQIPSDDWQVVEVEITEK